MDKDYFDLKFKTIAENQAKDNKIVIDTLEKITNKVSKLFDKTDKQHDVQVLQTRDIEDLQKENEKAEKANDKKDDRKWKFIINAGSKIAVALILGLLAFFQFAGVNKNKVEKQPIVIIEKDVITDNTGGKP